MATIDDAIALLLSDFQHCLSQAKCHADRSLELEEGGARRAYTHSAEAYKRRAAALELALTVLQAAKEKEQDKCP